MTEIKHTSNEKNGSFEILFDGRHAGTMTYTWAGTDKFIIDHTEVEEMYNGKGLGKEMVMAAIEFARKNNLKIMPLCPFAKKIFDADKTLSDVRF
ncbi:MAG: GNAT family N-acetyltransferase [Sediminibacterium sp.]|nr:GNAT family N-acetyltransferase [Sediminibacterium sp.]